MCVCSGGGGGGNSPGIKQLLLSLVTYSDSPNVQKDILC